MPQPFDPNEPHQLRADAPTLRPALAVQIAHIAALSATVEAFQGTLVAHLVEGDPDSSAALYTAMTSNVAQRAALMAVAIAKDLPEDTLKELKKLIERIKNVGRERNRIVHGIWGVAEGRDDALVNCSAQSWIALQSSTHDISNYSATTLEELSAKTERISVDRLEMLLYREADFKDLIGRTAALAEAIIAFGRKLKPSYYAPGDMLRPVLASVIEPHPDSSGNSPPNQ